MRRARSYTNVPRAAFVLLMLLGVTILFFFVVFHGRRGTGGTSLSSVGGSEHLKSRLLELARRRRGFWDFDLHAVIRRRVPTGPDPIHNRKVATNRQPPRT